MAGPNTPRKAEATNKVMVYLRNLINVYIKLIRMQTCVPFFQLCVFCSVTA